MKTFFSTTMITVLLFFIFGCTQKQSDQLTLQQIEQIKSESKAASEPLMSGWAALDADKALQSFSPEMVACMDSMLINYETYSKSWKGFTESTASIKITPIKEDDLVLTKDFTIRTGVYKVELLLKSGDKITYNPIRYTDVMKKSNGQWKIIFEQSSGIPIVQAAEKK